VTVSGAYFFVGSVRQPATDGSPWSSAWKRLVCHHFATHTKGVAVIDQTVVSCWGEDLVGGGIEDRALMNTASDRDGKKGEKDRNGKHLYRRQYGVRAAR